MGASTETSVQKGKLKKDKLRKKRLEDWDVSQITNWKTLVKDTSWSVIIPHSNWREMGTHRGRQYTFHSNGSHKERILD